MRLTRKQFMGSLLATGLCVCGRLACNFAQSVQRLTDEELIKGLSAANRQIVPANHDQAVPDAHSHAHDSQDPSTMILCYDELIWRGAAAFPVLIAHLTNTGKACAYIESDSRSRARPATIGQLCYRALLGEIRPWPEFIYDFHYRPVGATSLNWPAVPRGSDFAAAWYEERRDFTLFKFQTECVQKTIGLIEGAKEFYGGSGKRKEYLIGLRWCAVYLDRTRKAISVRATWYKLAGMGGALAAGSIFPDLVVDNAIEQSIGKPPFERFDGKTITGN